MGGKMETDTKISDMAYMLDNLKCPKEYPKLKFSLEILKRAIKDFEKRYKDFNEGEQ